MLTLIAFVFTFIHEREWRAAIKGFFVFTFLLLIFGFLLFADFPSQKIILVGLAFSTLLFTFILIFPFNKIYSTQYTDKQKKIDERDALFHRFYRLEPGTAEFEEYYEKHPEKKKKDESIRNLPSLGKQGSKSYHQITSLYQMATFDVVSKITREIEWEPEPIEDVPVKASPEELTKRIKGFARYFGADLVGATKLNPAYIYSHIGRSPGKWGEEIQLTHPNAIAIGVEMEHEMIRHSPGSATTTESAYKYFEAAKIAMTVARFINLLGYEARAHVDGNYRVMCIPIAADAGLGELGRLGLLVSPEYGPRVRLSIVTTNMPLIYDKPISFGVQHFCSFCKNCANSCPSSSIEKGDKKTYNGVKKWQSNQENCFKYWRTQGTDCAICIKVCPYSHPNTVMHNIIRWLIKRNNLTRRFLFWGDKFFYGAHNKNNTQLPDWHSI